MRECAKTLYVKNVEIWETENDKKGVETPEELKETIAPNGNWKKEMEDAYS